MNSDKFLFSIIIPVYNTGKYIEKCLKSVQEASGKDCEIIIVNDGSTDNSEEIILDFINNLPSDIKSNYIYIISFQTYIHIYSTIHPPPFKTFYTIHQYLFFLFPLTSHTNKPN